MNIGGTRNVVQGVWRSVVDCKIVITGLSIHSRLRIVDVSMTPVGKSQCWRDASVTGFEEQASSTIALRCAVILCLYEGVVIRLCAVEATALAHGGS